MTSKKIRKFLKAFSLIGLGWWLLGLIGAFLATSAHRKKIPALNKLGKHIVDTINFKSEDDIKISAWWIENTEKTSKKAVIIMPGVWSDRSTCIGRAELYLEKGYSVLLPDLRGTGESEGNYQSFGWHEQKDLLAACQFLEDKEFEVAVHGISLGAATIIYSFNQKTDYDFVVLEACYDNIHNAFQHRVKILSLDSWLCLPLRLFVKWRIQTTPQQLAPEKYIHLYKGRILLIAGEKDQWVYHKDTFTLYQNIGSKEKSLAWIPEARHEDFLKASPEHYQRILTDFIKY